MAKKPTKAQRKPKDLTDYSLRGIRNDISTLTSTLQQLKAQVEAIEAVLGV